MSVDTIIEKLNESSIKSNLSCLSFEGRGLKLDDEASAKEIITEITNFENLESLELKGNTLGIEAAKAIGKALESKSKLKHALWSDLFTGRLKSEIPAALKHLCNGVSIAGAQLVELDLSDNAFGPNGMSGLVDFLAASACFQLKILKLNNNGLGITGGKMLADSLTKNLEAAKAKNVPGIRLEIFVSGRGRLEDEGALALSKPFKMMGSLIEVHMPQNGINHKGISALSEAFIQNVNLRVINLADNTFTEKGALSMAQAVKVLTHVEEINFEDCLLRSKGCMEMSRVLLDGHTNLKILRLGGNEMNRESGEAIAKAVANKPQLHLLELNSNSFGLAGTNSIKNIMKSFNKLEFLSSLSDNEESDVNSDDNSDDDDDDDDNNDNSDRSRNMINVSVDSFLESPSSESLKILSRQDPQFHKQHIVVEPTNVEEVITALMKVSIAYEEGDKEVVKIANSCADSLLDPIFKPNDLSSLACNQLLVSLGFIKSEDKKKIKPTNLRASLLLLDHCVHQNYFPKSSKDTIKFFLEKPDIELEGCDDVKKKLLDYLSL